MTEKKIQKHIWDNKSDWKEMLKDFEFPSKRDIENPSHLTPADAIYNLVIEKTEELYKSLYDLDLFGCEVPLKKESDSTIRADFIGLFGGRNGLAVIELKKSEQTERQAYTELLAYGGHIRTVFAPMSKMDIAYILISPMEERIVREATINSILYDKTNVIALIPKWENDDVTTLKLEPWIPDFKEIQELTSASFSEKNFNVFKVTWDALEGDWSPEEEREDPDQDMIDKMNTVSAYAAQIMESKGIHGFVFTSQNWSELKKVGHLINGIVLVGLNPYKSTKNRVLIKNRRLSKKEADELSIEHINILEIIPELANSAEKENLKLNHLSHLSMTWNNEITGIGFDIVKTLTKNLENNLIETDHGGFDWDIYQTNYLEDGYCHNFKIRVTGLIRELFFEYSKLDYDFIREHGYDDHLQYWNGDIPHYLVDISTNQYYVRKFIRRLFNPYHDFYDEFE